MAHTKRTKYELSIYLVIFSVGNTTIFTRLNTTKFQHRYTFISSALAWSCIRILFLFSNEQNQTLACPRSRSQLPTHQTQERCIARCKRVSGEIIKTWRCAQSRHGWPNIQFRFVCTIIYTFGVVLYGRYVSGKPKTYSNWFCSLGRYSYSYAGYPGCCSAVNFFLRTMGSVLYLLWASLVVIYSPSINVRCFCYYEILCPVSLSRWTKCEPFTHIGSLNLFLKLFGRLSPCSCKYINTHVVRMWESYPIDLSKRCVVILMKDSEQFNICIILYVCVY